jgi:hypothetical protein
LLSCNGPSPKSIISNFDVTIIKTFVTQIIHTGSPRLTRKIKASQFHTQIYSFKNESTIHITSYVISTSKTKNLKIRTRPAYNSQARPCASVICVIGVTADLPTLNSTGSQRKLSPFHVIPETGGLAVRTVDVLSLDRQTEASALLILIADMESTGCGGFGLSLSANWAVFQTGAYLLQLSEPEVLYHDPTHSTCLPTVGARPYDWLDNNMLLTTPEMNPF